MDLVDTPKCKLSNLSNEGKITNEQRGMEENTGTEEYLPVLGHNFPLSPMSNQKEPKKKKLTANKRTVNC